MRFLILSSLLFSSLTAGTARAAPVQPLPLDPTARVAPVVQDKAGAKSGKDADKTEKARRPMPRFETFPQEAWGRGKDSNPRVTEAFRKHFDAAFPEGLRLGVDGDKSKNVIFKNADALRKFLPNRGSPGAMSDGTREGAEDAGGLAGHLAAAKLNIQFNRAGFLGEKQEGVKNPLDMKDLVFRRGVAIPLRGKSVGEVVKLADRALSGAFGDGANSDEKAIDVDGDGKPDVSFDQLRKALVAFNENFADGSNEERLGHRKYTNVRAEDEGEEAAAAAAAADRDDDPVDEDVEKARDERDRELDAAEQEYDKDIKDARAAARRSGDVSKYEEKKAELDARYAAKRAQIDEKFRKKMQAFREKHGREHPGRGRGLEKKKDGDSPERGSGRGGDRPRGPEGKDGRGERAGG